MLVSFFQPAVIWSLFPNEPDDNVDRFDEVCKEIISFLSSVLSDSKILISDEDLIKNIDAESEAGNPHTTENRRYVVCWQFYDIYAQVREFKLEKWNILKPLFADPTFQSSSWRCRTHSNGQITSRISYWARIFVDTLDPILSLE